MYKVRQDASVTSRLRSLEANALATKLTLLTAVAYHVLLTCLAPSAPVGDQCDSALRTASSCVPLDPAAGLVPPSFLPSRLHRVAGVPWYYWPGVVLCCLVYIRMTRYTLFPQHDAEPQAQLQQQQPRRRPGARHQAPSDVLTARRFLLASGVGRAFAEWSLEPPASDSNSTNLSAATAAAPLPVMRFRDHNGAVRLFFGLEQHASPVPGVSSDAPSDAASGHGKGDATPAVASSSASEAAGAAAAAAASKTTTMRALPFLQLQDEFQRVRVRAQLLGPDNDAHIALHDAHGAPRCRMALLHGDVSLTLADASDRPRIRAVVGHTDQCQLTLLDPTQVPRFRVSVADNLDCDPVLSLHDSTGTPRLRASYRHGLGAHVSLLRREPGRSSVAVVISADDSSASLRFPSLRADGPSLDLTHSEDGVLEIRLADALVLTYHAASCEPMIQLTHVASGSRIVLAVREDGHGFVTRPS